MKKVLERGARREKSLGARSAVGLLLCLSECWSAFPIFRVSSWNTLVLRIIYVVQRFEINVDQFADESHTEKDFLRQQRKINQ